MAERLEVELIRIQDSWGSVTTVVRVFQSRRARDPQDSWDPRNFKVFTSYDISANFPHRLRSCLRGPTLSEKTGPLLTPRIGIGPSWSDSRCLAPPASPWSCLSEKGMVVIASQGHSW